MPSTAAAAVTTATPAASTSTTWTSTASAAISTGCAITPAWTICASLGCAFPIEVRLIRIIRKISATFNDQRTRRNRLPAFHRCNGRRSFPTAHFRALLFQDCFARESNAVPFDRQYLDQNLVALLQLVAYIGNAMLRHFADVQQSFRARNDFDKRAEISQPRDFAEISLPHLRGRRDVSDNLQRLLR
jgi:hypothetical protein